MTSPNNKTGVYLIKNIKNNHYYVGSASKSFEYRWKEHTRKLKMGNHCNKYLQSAWKKYGQDSFEFIILEIVENKAEIIKREQYYINTLVPDYNLSPTAASMLGYRHTEESKLKMKKAKLGKVPWNKNKSWSSEMKEKLSKAHIGKTLSKEHKDNISKSVKNADLTNTIRATKERQNKPVYCVELDITFNSMLEAAAYLKLNYDHMTVRINKNKKVKGYTLKRVQNGRIS